MHGDIQTLLRDSAAEPDRPVDPAAIRSEVRRRGRRRTAFAGSAVAVAAVAGVAAAAALVGPDPEPPVFFDHPDAQVVELPPAEQTTIAGNEPAEVIAADRCERGFAQSTLRGEQIAAVRDGDAVFALYSDGHRPYACMIDHVYRGGGSTGAPTEGFAEFDPQTQTIIVDDSGTTARGGDAQTPPESALSYIHGRIGEDVARVVITREDGTDIEAVLAEGHFVAAWNWLQGALTVRAYEADGELLAEIDRTQDLADHRETLRETGYPGYMYDPTDDN